MADKQSFSYEDIEAAANIVLGKISKPPVIAVVCGKNIDTFPDTFEDKVDIPYEEINFPPATIPKCSVLTCGTLGGVSIVAFRGRFYLHKGASIDRLVLPARLSKLLGVKVMVLVSSASAINEGYNPGDLMFLKDHINFVGFGSDKVATADERWGGGSRTLKYNELRKCAMDSAANSGFPGQVHEGVYVCASMGKHQTVMETKMFKQLGGDVVGTSIAYETLAAVECNIEVVGLAIVTATVPLDYDGEMKKWDWLDDTIPPLMGEIVKGVTNCMKEQGMLEEEAPPEAQEDEKPPEEAPEEEKAHDEPEEEKPTEEAEAVVGEGAEEGEPPEDAEKEKPLETGAEDEKIQLPGDEGTPAAEEEKKPKKPCECKKKPSEAAPPPPEQPPEQPPEEKKKKRSCECKDKKKAESGAAAPGGPAASASKVPSATTPAGGASAAKVPSAATPVGGASAAKVPSAATPTGGASAAKVPSAATPTGGASAAKVPSAATPGAGTPVGGASAAKVPSGVNPEQEEEAEQ